MSGWTIAGLIVLAVAAVAFLGVFLRNWWRYRGTRIVTCPENLEPAAVGVDALHAAEWKAVSGDAPLRLNTCSRWPEREDCGQECLAQIAASPEACLVQSIVTAWYAGKECAYCQKPIGEIVWHERPPALRAPDGTSVEWKDVRPEQLPKLFATHLPVCWACHIREGFRHDHPDLVIERPRPVEPQHTIRPSSSVY